MVFADTAFIVNPHAGSGSTGTYWPHIEKTARRLLGSFDSVLTKAAGDAAKIATEMVSRGVKRIVGVGGDGTLNEIINGIMAKQDLLKADFTLGFIPNGSGCDIVKTLAIPKDNDEAVAVVAAGKKRSLDIGCMRYQDHTGSTGTRYFHNIVSFGLGGEVVKRVNQSSKRLGPAISFLMATITAVLRHSPQQIHLTIDGGIDAKVPVWHAAAANGRFQGGGMLVAPDANPADGWLDITVIGDLRLWEIFLNLRHLYDGKLFSVKKVSHFRTKRICATSDELVYLDVDGEQPGTLPVEIDIIPAALNIITA